LTAADAAAQRARVRAFYDRWTPAFVDGFGTTLQAGLAKASPQDHEDPAASSRLLAARAGVRDGDRILDAGCGVGGPAVAIAAAHPHVRIDGVTISPVQVELGRHVIEDAGLAKRVTIARADYHHLPFADATFDCVLFLESCGYSPDRRALFAEAARVVRPGGQIYVKDVFARPPPLGPTEQETLLAFDDLWGLASSPTIPDVTAAFAAAGCEVLAAGELADVGNSRFIAAMVEPDPKTILRLNELGRAFALSLPDCPTFFGEVLGRRL
jgi:cyclopropane fatty-acyl-phospholipid synthase-like methyltransferase